LPLRGLLGSLLDDRGRQIGRLASIACAPSTRDRSFRSNEDRRQELAIAAAARNRARKRVAGAREYRLRTLRIDHPFARATPPERARRRFLKRRNKGDRTDRLLTVSTPVAGTAELHQMVMDAGVDAYARGRGPRVKPGDRGAAARRLT
jgi:hypothetical protein